MRRKQKTFWKLETEGEHDGKLFLDPESLEKYVFENKIEKHTTKKIELWEKLEDQNE